MPVRQIRAGALAAPLLLALLSACGGGDHSVADPPVSTATSSPTQSPQRETPEHFIRRWADAEARMENTGKTAAYARMTSGCLSCRSLIEDVKKFYAAGGFIHWDGLKVLSVKRAGPHSGAGIAYEVVTDSTPTRYKESASGSVQTIKGGVTKEQVSLNLVRGQYVVVARSRLPR